MGLRKLARVHVGVTVDMNTEHGSDLLQLLAAASIRPLALSSPGKPVTYA